MKSCLFCEIIAKKIEAKFIYEDADVVVIPDVNPKNRTHYLVLPTEHIKSVLDIQSNQEELLTKMLKVVQTLIDKESLQDGYQLIFNGGHYQHVPHLHWHLLGD